MGRTQTSILLIVIAFIGYMEFVNGAVLSDRVSR